MRRTRGAEVSQVCKSEFQWIVFAHDTSSFKTRSQNPLLTSQYFCSPNSSMSHQQGYKIAFYSPTFWFSGNVLTECLSVKTLSPSIIIHIYQIQTHKYKFPEKLKKKLSLEKNSWSNRWYPYFLLMKNLSCIDPEKDEELNETAVQHLTSTLSLMCVKFIRIL